MTDRESRRLRTLASLHRVQTSYIDMHGRRCFAPADALIAVLGALESPVTGLGDVEDAIRARVNCIQNQWVAPALVAWNGSTDGIAIRLPLTLQSSHAVGPRLQYTLRLENGDIWSGNILTDQMRTVRRVSFRGAIYAVRPFLPSKPLPFGYHKLTVQIGRRAFHSTVISAPRVCFREMGAAGHTWGVFAPLYALRTERNWGVGDFTDASVVASWAASKGGCLFATLPFLAAYLDNPCDPSPYTPISRFFWNELFIDVTRIPELANCTEAQQLIASSEFRREMRSLHAERLVDYRRAMALKRGVLSALARNIVKSPGRSDALAAFVADNPDVDTYARFRALTHDRRSVWTDWPDAASDSLPDEIRGSHDEANYHTYVQFVADEQVRAFRQSCKTERISLYLDYPLGTHPQGYDTWRYRENFAMDVTAGAPPDPVFTTGQDWGFHPQHPERQRRDGYGYLARSLRRQMSHCEMLRLDHVMGLHRLYWIPKGFSKSHGVYVRYPSDEIYAVICLESHRSQTAIVGENLGIVPGYVTSAMRDHGLAGMNVAYWEVASDPERALQKIASQPDTVTSLNTHDMFPFAAFWHGQDADRRAELGMISSEQADLERWVRGELRARLTSYLRARGFAIDSEDDSLGALRAMLTLIAGSRARWVLVNLEDLWLETSPQNIPDTVDEHPNWRQKTKLSIEEFVRDSVINELLAIVEKARCSVNS